MIKLYTFEGVNGTGKSTAIKDFVELTGFPVIKQKYWALKVESPFSTHFEDWQYDLWTDFISLVEWRIKTEHKTSFILDRGAFTQLAYYLAWREYFSFNFGLENLMFNGISEFFKGLQIKQTVVWFKDMHKEREKIPKEVTYNAGILFNSLFTEGCRAKHPLFKIDKLYTNYKKFKHDYSTKI